MFPFTPTNFPLHSFTADKRGRFCWLQSGTELQLAGYNIEKPSAKRRRLELEEPNPETAELTHDQMKTPMQEQKVCLGALQPPQLGPR